MNRYLNLIIKIAILNFLVFLGIGALYNHNWKKPSPQAVSTATQVTPVPTEPTTTQATPTSVQNVNRQVTKTPTPTPTVNLFAEVPKHNNSNSCWMIIGGHIYDVTTYLGSHSGGDASILKYCGQDATTAFNTQDRSPGRPHSGAAANLLQQYLIK